MVYKYSMANRVDTKNTELLRTEAAMTLMGNLTGNSRWGTSGSLRNPRIPADMRPMHDVAVLADLFDVRSLYHLAVSTDHYMRRSAAEHPLCPLDVLNHLANDINTIVVMVVARNPNCSPQLLAKLSVHSAWQVRYEVAGHRACPDDRLPVLLDDPDKGVRQRCASRRPMPDWLLELAMEHTDPVVRYMATIDEPW